MVFKDIWKGVGIVFCLLFTVLLAFLAGYVVKYYLWMERDDEGNLRIRHDIEKVDMTHWALGFAVIIPLYVGMILLVKLANGGCCTKKEKEPESDWERAVKMAMLRPQERVVLVNNNNQHPTDPLNPLGIYYPTIAEMPPPSPSSSTPIYSSPRVELIGN